MVKRIVVILILACSSITLIAQQLPHYSQYMFDGVAINPAYAGSKNIVFGALTHRMQFTGFEGAPVTQKLTLNAPIQSKYMGVGIRALHDKIGVSEVISVMGIYSYHIGVGKGKVSFGLEGGFMNQTIDFSSLIRTDVDDIALSYSKESVFVPDVSFGIYYHDERFYLGGSSFHLLEGKTNFTGNERELISKMSRHYFITTGYKFMVSEKIDFEPSILSKVVQGAPSQFDLNANVVWNKMIALGGSYRTGDGLSFLFRYLIKEKFVVGYSYDLTLSELANYSTGSHEIMLGYQIKLLPPAREKVTDPRYYF